MKEQNLRRERKQSLNRLPVNVLMKTISSSSEFKRKGVFSKQADTEQIHHSFASKCLVGWGKIPFGTQQTFGVQTIGKEVLDFSSGQEHIVFINASNQVYGMGSNRFGQLGLRQNNRCTNQFLRVFQQYKIVRIYCTQFCTFILSRKFEPISERNQLYACGLNNRGQLGVATQGEFISKPHLIQKLSEQKDGQIIKKQSSRSRITSVYSQQLRKQKVYFENEKIDTGRNSNLQAGEAIIDIRGGPFHTVVLTSKGRLFYSGNLYKSQSLSQNQFTSQFIQLNTSKLGRIKSVRCSLTSLCFLTAQGNLHLLGFFNSKLFNEPQKIECSNIMSYDLNDQGIYILDSLRSILLFSTGHKQLLAQKISLQRQVQDVYCGLDFTLAVTKTGQIYGQGDNSQHQIDSDNQFFFKDFKLLKISTQQNPIVLRCSNNFVLGLLPEPFYLQLPKESNNDFCKVKDLQRQNRILKELLCNKNKKNIKIQTEKQSKFDLPQPLNARTFDTSMEIPFEQLKLGKQISEGGYGIIFKATWRKSVVAVKVFKIELQNQNAIRDFISECHAMQALRHPNIVMFLGACTKPPHFAIVLEYCEGGTVWALLQKQNQELSWDERRDLALDVAKGMNYLHERSTPILHRDLKSLNLLLDHNRRVKLADFGWTKGLQNYMTGKIGTYQWMAPEVISAYQYTQKADVFSFGIILWQMASRQAPYRNIPGPQVAQDVLSKDLRPIVPKKTPQAFAELMRSCWDKCAQNRPSFNQIICSLQQMNFC